MRKLFWVLILALSMPLLSGPSQARQTGKVTFPVTQDLVIKEFSNRVNAYIRLRKNVEGSFTAQKSSKDSAELAAHKIELAAMIVAARPAARQGDIFAPDIAVRFRDIIRQTLQGPRAQAIRRTVQDQDPIVPIILKVNAVYPETSPVQTTPPTLLGRFPELPMDLAYRFVGRALILLDSKTRLIVDFMPDALP